MESRKFVILLLIAARSFMEVDCFEPETEVKFLFMTKEWNKNNDRMEFSFNDKSGFESEIDVDFHLPLIFIIHGFMEGREGEHYINLIKYLINLSYHI